MRVNEWSRVVSFQAYWYGWELPSCSTSIRCSSFLITPHLLPPPWLFRLTPSCSSPPSVGSSFHLLPVTGPLVSNARRLSAASETASVLRWQRSWTELIRTARLPFMNMERTASHSCFSQSHAHIHEKQWAARVDKLDTHVACGNKLLIQLPREGLVKETVTLHLLMRPEPFSRLDANCYEWVNEGAVVPHTLWGHQNQWRGGL